MSCLSVVCRARSIIIVIQMEEKNSHSLPESLLIGKEEMILKICKLSLFLYNFVYHFKYLKL
jgi:hypothetical protein